MLNVKLVIKFPSVEYRLRAYNRGFDPLVSNDMLASASGSSTYTPVRCGHANPLSPTDVSDVGICTLIKPALKNAYCPIDVTVLGKSIELRFVQSRNASVGIYSMFDGQETDAMLLQPLNAPILIDAMFSNLSIPISVS